MTTKQKAYIGLALTSSIWGTSWVASKIGVQSVPGLELAAIRQFLAGTLFVCFFLIKGQPLPTRKEFVWLTGMSILLFVSANGIATIALKYIPSGLAALIAALYPLSVVILERIFFRNTKITTVTFIGLLLGICGIAVVFYDNAFLSNEEGYTWGVVLSMVAMLSWSIGTILIARTKTKLNTYYATGWEMLISSVLLFVMLLLSGQRIPLSAIPLEAWGAITYLVLVSSIVAFAAFIYTMKHLETAVASLYAYINPIVAMLAGSLLVDEKLTLNILIGSLITITGVFLVNRSLKKQKDSMNLPDPDAV